VESANLQLSDRWGDGKSYFVSERPEMHQKDYLKTAVGLRLAELVMGH
jgi:hypothetical protein